MKVVVITGSSRGLGLGLAQSFLSLGCAVTISGSTPESTAGPAEALARQYGRDRVFGCPCDVLDPRQVQNLWDASRQVFSKIDIWVNNAGISNPLEKFWDQPDETINGVVAANILGTLYSAKTALRGMLTQGHGALYTMLGMGSTGRIQDGLLLYGTSKAALHYFTVGLAQEVRGSAVLVGALSPGMVLTDMMTESRRTSPETWKNVKHVLNLLGERVETVTPWMAKRMLDNTKNAMEIRWLTAPRLLWKMLSYPFNRQRVVK